MTPPVSVVLATDRAELLVQPVEGLREQEVWSRLELVVVRPRGAAVELPGALVDGIGGVQVVDADPFAPLSEARAAGVRAAAADTVFIGETHSWLAPGSLDVLLRTLREGGYGAVVPEVVPANPARAASWANLFLTYRDLVAPAGARLLVEIPTYSSCMRRAALLAYGERLAAMLQYGNGLGPDLTRRGHRLWFEPGAQVLHQNVASLHATVVDRFLGARSWGATRSGSWPAARRLLYAAGSPLIPPLTLARVLRSPQWAHARPRLPRGTLPWLALAACSLALGEGVGYALGAGSSGDRLVRWELDRRAHV